jgi:hypothetical protein
MSKELTDARTAAFQFITSREHADNFRNPEEADRMRLAGKPTSIAGFDLSAGTFTRPQLQEALDDIAAGEQERLRQATQRLVLAEQGAVAGARAIGDNTLNQLVRVRMREIVDEVARGIGHDAPSLGKGVGE